MVPVSWYIILSAIMFTLGALGVIVRRNAIVVFMCIELMLNGVNIAFVALSHVAGNINGQVAVFFVMVVAAAEAAIGLAVIITVFRSVQSIETQNVGELKG
ncbi:MAG: NADH-quinone oxidoreductase subunit NuoK [Candidatus Dadabacteria bacterium]|nr:MAG: NADH-quinone oxidoreductase subunit NuoK [Candidatus Dadabacteria bacterium]